jgi:hypothetical protein
MNAQDDNTAPSRTGMRHVGESSPVQGQVPPHQGQPPYDPTQNVLNLVQAAISRQDDMRNLVARHADDMATLRADYDAKLRSAETDRINAIRAVDVGAVAAAAQVSATQATTLAAQVATSAETLRTQVAAAATAATVALAAALEPIQKDIADLRRAQYEAQGQKTQVVETRETRADNRLSANAIMQAAALLLAALIVYATFHK